MFSPNEIDKNMTVKTKKNYLIQMQKNDKNIKQYNIWSSNSCY